MPYPLIRRIGPSCLLLALFLSGTVGPAVAEQPARKSAERAWQQLERGKLALRSKAALVVDAAGNTLYARSAETPMPIASLTKLMTAMVILDAGLPLDEKIEIDRTDRDLVKLTGSRLEVGARLTRRELVILALMASENRAASALARTYPGGEEAFVRAMNARAGTLGMSDSRFTDAAGLDPGNVASAKDLAQLVFAAMEYPLVREASTRRSLEVRPYKRRGPLRFGNTNRLLRSAGWDIQLSKTGYINEAGRCLVMHTELEGRPTVLVLLNSFGKLTPFGDANRVRRWLEQHAGALRPASAMAPGDSGPPG
jgi:D-alanyl-D-alanine endopeptidase (penicillin-binding protein 7)